MPAVEACARCAVPNVVTEDNSLSENEPSCYVSMEYNITFPIYQMFGENKSKKVVIEGYAR